MWLVRLGDWIRDLTAAPVRSARSANSSNSRRRWRGCLRGEVVTAVPVSALAADDTVVVHSGEMIPVDGEILTGHGDIDQKTITGESLPVLRGEDEMVYAATALREGYITVRATRVGSGDHRGADRATGGVRAGGRDAHTESCGALCRSTGSADAGTGGRHGGPDQRTSTGSPPS